MNTNNNISIWRGSNTPPTKFHLWLKNNKLYHFDGIDWIENKVETASYENDGLMSKEDKERLDNLVYDGLDSTDIDKALSANLGNILLNKINDLKISAYKVKGSVENFDNLPTENLEIGDVYNILNSFYIDNKKYPEGTNVVWTGSKWDPLGGTVDFKDYSTTEQIEEIITNLENDISDSFDNVNNSLNNINDLLDNLSNTKADKVYTDLLLETKVDKISGKGLSTNDYTTEEKNKLEFLSNLNLSYATSELYDLSSPNHKANINEIRINLNIMGISMINSVSIIVASDSSYNGDLYMRIYDMNNNLVSTSNNSINLSLNLGQHITWYFTPFRLIKNAIYRFSAWDASGTKQTIRIHCASNKNEGVNCFDSNDSPHTDYCPAFGVNIGAIFADDLYKKILPKANKTYVDTLLATKVDKISGKGLSTNDYTTEEKNLVATIPSKASEEYVDNNIEQLAKQRTSFVTPCFSDCDSTHEAKCNSITLSGGELGFGFKSIFSVTIKIAENLSLLNQTSTYLHIKDLFGNSIGVSMNGVKQMQNLGKYVTWFFDSVINTSGGPIVLSLHTTNVASSASDSNLVKIIAHVNQSEGMKACGVTDENGTYHTNWTPALGINVVNLAAIYPQIKELQKYRMAYATSELPDISTTGHKANVKEIRINQNVMGISLVNSVSIMVASDSAYSGALELRVYDINDNLIATSNNTVNLSQNLGKYVTWYFTPFQLNIDAVYRFSVWNSEASQVMRIHVASGKNEGITCYDQNNSPHTDYCPAFGINISAIFADDLRKSIKEVNLALGNQMMELNMVTDNLSTKMTNMEANLNNVFTGLEEILAYGVEWDTEVADPHLTRIGNMSLHKTLPIQSQLKGCIAQKDKVIYWLNENDWRFKKDPEIVSMNLIVNERYLLVSDVFSTIRYERLWIKIDGVVCLLGSIYTNTNTADIIYNDQLDALGLVTGTKNVELGAVLNGYDGTVRVYCPNFYIKSEIDGTKRRVWISTVKIDNSYTYQHEILVDAYRSTVLNTVPTNMGYLSTLPVNSAISVVNEHTYCRGGNNRDTYDMYIVSDPSRTDLCKPRTNMSRATMRTYSRNAGSEMLSYDLYKNIFYWLYVIEYANFNCQEAYNEAVTAEGYKLGGLGVGITTINSTYWNYYNSYYPLTPCGYCNELGNGTGLKTMTVVTPTTSGGDPTLTYNFSVPRWRGFDNPFGDIWTNLDGIIIQGDAEGNPKTVYTTTDPNNYGDNESAKNAMEIAGHEIHQDGYIKEFDLGEAAHIIPESVGGNATKYKCDYHYTGSKNTSLITLFVGGSANDGASVGLGAFNSRNGVSVSNASIGFRSVSTFVSFSE